MTEEKIGRSRINTTNGTEIVSVGSFLQEIRDLRNNDDGKTQKYFFRGQQTEYWGISSSIFRSGLLNVEHKLLKDALEKYPNEFKAFNNTFDLMTKCQHYGLCTRLLDLTTNPLVALYFACQKNGEEAYELDPEQEYDDDNMTNEQMEPYGVIYYKKDYPVYSDTKEVKIITELAKLDLQKNGSLNNVLNDLLNNDIITQQEHDSWQKDNYKEFIKIIQSTYVVQPTYNNTRLVAQSGAFLLPGLFSFNYGRSNTDKTDSTITKCKGDLRKEFEDNFFYILGEKKNDILEELNLCNINESTLFPELEHQLGYIKTLNLNQDFEAPDFEKYEETEIEITPEIISQDEENPNFKSDILTIIEQKISDEDLVNKILESIINNISVDWYRKDSIKNSIKRDIAKELIKNSFNHENAKTYAEDILNSAITVYKKE